MTWRKRGPECCQHYAVLRLAAESYTLCFCKLCGHRWEEWPL